MSDVRLTDLGDGRFLAVACDSSGGIGNLEHDIVKVDPETTGYFTAWVALSELLAVRAEVVSVVDNLALSWEPNGKRIVAGIRKVMDELDIPAGLLTGSTEENMTVSSTGIGVTGIGIVTADNLTRSVARTGDKVVVVGIPKMGERLVAEELTGKMGEIMLPVHLKSLLEMEEAGTIRPVGSKGISYEIGDLKRIWQNQGLEFVPDLNASFNNFQLYDSAGPATCCICTIHGEDFVKNVPISVLGYLKDMD